MVYVNKKEVDCTTPITVGQLIEICRDIKEFKQYFIFNTYVVHIDNQYIERDDYDTVTVEDGGSITLRALPMGG